MPEFYINDFELKRVNVNGATTEIIQSITQYATDAEFKERVLEVAR